MGADRRMRHPEQRFAEKPNEVLCAGKVKLTFDQAQQIARRPTNKEKRRIGYKCMVCGGWHIRTQPPKSLRNPKHGKGKGYV